MSEIKWPEYFPKSCPPDDAQNISITVYRFTDKPTPTPKDFRTNREKRPNEDFGDNECLACGLSVYTNPEDIKIKQQRVPGMNRKHITRIDIEPDSGVFKRTPNQGDSHATWWVYPGIDPLKYCK